MSTDFTITHHELGRWAGEIIARIRLEQVSYTILVGGEPVADLLPHSVADATRAARREAPEA